MIHYWQLTGTVVIGNLWSTTHNTQLYTDPSQFKADRFLDGEGKFAKPSSKLFTPFGIGEILWHPLRLLLILYTLTVNTAWAHRALSAGETVCINRLY